MADLAGSLGFQQCFQCAAGSGDGGNVLLARVMDLVQIDIIGAQILKGGFNVCGHSFLGAGHALGCDHKFVTNALQTVTQILLADGIATGSIDIVHTGIQKLQHQFLGSLCVNTLNGNSTKSQV